MEGSRKGIFRNMNQNIYIKIVYIHTHIYKNI